MLDVVSRLVERRLFVRAQLDLQDLLDALAALGHTYARSANISAALGVLKQLSDLSKERYVSPYGIALIHAALGQPDLFQGVRIRDGDRQAFIKTSRQVLFEHSEHHTAI